MGIFGADDPQLLSDGAVYSKMRDLIAEAKETLLIVSPYIDPTGDFLRQVVTASTERRVDVEVVFRRDALEKYRRQDWFHELDAAKVKLGTIDRLHSKIYANEIGVLLTSMNFYSTSGENSFEVGVYFEADHELNEKLVEYINSLQRHIEPASSTAPRARRNVRDAASSHEKSAEEIGGFCIRCAKTLPLNTAKPLCATDYSAWAKTKDRDHEETYCHSCGMRHSTSLREPLCDDCRGRPLRTARGRR